MRKFMLLLPMIMVAGTAGAATTCPTGTGWHTIVEPYLSYVDGATGQCPAGTYGGVEDTGEMTCPDGQVASGGQCLELCKGGFTKLFTSTGLSFNVYETKSTPIALAMQNADGKICYVNLAEGDNVKGVINVQYNGKNYYTTD